MGAGDVQQSSCHPASPKHEPEHCQTYVGRFLKAKAARRGAGKSGWLMGRLPSPRAAGKLEGCSKPGLRGFAQAVPNSRGEAEPCCCGIGG